METFWRVAGRFCNWRWKRCDAAVMRWAGWCGDVNAREDTHAL